MVCERIKEQAVNVNERKEKERQNRQINRKDTNKRSTEN